MNAIEPGFQFASDNTSGVCPEAWNAMLEANSGYAASYGDDPWTKRARELVREIFEFDCHVYFIFNGTAANSLALASMCQSYHSVLAHQLAHVETDECGGPEFFSNGTKLLLVEGEGGRVDPAAVEKVVRRRSDVHFPKPKVLSITQATEMGTVYRGEDLDRIYETARRLHLNLHMDGSRFANALATLNVSPKELTWKAGVDVLCLGGTKNGMAVGDCVVFFDDDLAYEFEYRCKQAGQLASKMRYLSAPWVGLLESGVWLKNAQHANAMARLFAERLQAFPGVSVRNNVESNAVFLQFPPAVAAALRSAGWHFHDFIGVGESRLMCSWNTTEQEIEAFLKSLADAIKQNP
ncbi:Low specificity L-threonine aldolase [Rosistilla ulvae]|uniref:L-threonine aldolase n=1 Tax=Rosistilla ulvae TaxID=1930277 RepID=A0A517M3D1_9BACT|nr:low specificity L-threonine aldolase [Rosistilla ulvae]QDS89381.1 Low specificity L-threonine aldolase [Rosistilla ulvae]